MANKKELTAKVFICDHDEQGNARQRRWEEICPEEQKTIAIKIQDNAMAALGYTRISEFDTQKGQSKRGKGR